MHYSLDNAKYSTPNPGMTKRQVKEPSSARRVAPAAPPSKSAAPRSARRVAPAAPPSSLNPFAPLPYSNPIALTPEQVEVEVLAGVLEGESAAGAGRLAGTEHGTAIMARPRVRSALVEALEARGVGDARLAAVLDEGLSAQQRMVVYKDGSAAPECADHDVRHKFLSTALKIRRCAGERGFVGGYHHSPAAHARCAAVSSSAARTVPPATPVPGGEGPVLSATSTLRNFFVPIFYRGYLAPTSY
jgi:hypothetical protein